MRSFFRATTPLILTVLALFGSACAAVAQRAVLFEEDPADSKAKRFRGSVVWQAQSVSLGAAGQLPEPWIKAEIEVPERKFVMTWSLRRNNDRALSASHLVHAMFNLPANHHSGGISMVPGILMKQAEQKPGVPLAGYAIRVAQGLFLISLLDADGN